MELGNIMLTTNVKNNLVYGVLTLVPLGAGLVVLFKLISALETLTEKLNLGSNLGTAIAVILAIVAFLVLTYIVGALVRTSIGLYLHEHFEQKILVNIPGYKIISRILKGGVEGDNDYKPALIQLYGEGTSVFGFIMEQNPNDTMTIFVPSSPALSVGVVHVVLADRVKQLDAGYMDVFNCLSEWGVGSSKLVTGARHSRAPGDFSDSG